MSPLTDAPVVPSLDTMEALAPRTVRLAEGPTDTLTGLPLLPSLHALLDAQVKATRRGGASLAAMVIDIDHFTDLNHALGRSQADALLVSVSSGLRLSLPANAVLGRRGGSTFVAMLPDIASPSHAVRAARRLQHDLIGLQSLQLPGLDDSQQARSARRVTCSIGISLGPTQGEDADQLLRHAESALDAARAGGRSSVELFNADQAQALNARRMVMLDLPAALQRSELTLRYQPQFSVATGRLVGVEALLRWRHPRHGLIMPDRFIGAAEACGLIEDIGHWVLEEACTQARRWQDQGLPQVPMAVNVSARQLLQPTFLLDVQAALHRARLSPDRLELEITESALMHRPERVFELLRQCRQQGLRVSLDDFGTGHANLKTLRRMPVDQIKIDRSFLDDLPGDARTGAVVRALIQMAHALDIDVLAEGVETAEQLASLRAEGCTALQGHLFAEALDPRVFEAQPWRSV